MAKQLTNDERLALLTTEVCEGYTYGDLLLLLPKMDMEAIMKMDSKKLVESMQDYVLARLHVEFMAGNPAAMAPIAKLHLEPHLARAKVTAILQNGAGQRKGIQVEGSNSQIDSLLDRVLAGNVHLPEGDFKTGMKNLQEVQQNG